jgi:hypothetical protein
MKLEWAMAVEDAEVASDSHAITRVGRPFSATLVGQFPDGGITLDLPVLLMFSTDPTPGVQDFTFSWYAVNPDGEKLDGRKTRVMLGVETTPGWPSEWEHPYPMVHSILIPASRLGPYEIRFWVNENREEVVQLRHLLAAG